jgi:hypothetical protein
MNDSSKLFCFDIQMGLIPKSRSAKCGDERGQTMLSVIEKTHEKNSISSG